jgi:hypothetical protein
MIDQVHNHDQDHEKPITTRTTKAAEEICPLLLRSYDPQPVGVNRNP